MTEGPPDVSRIKDDGWRQGSALPAALVDHLSRDGLLPWPRSQDDVLIVLSHDCDVTNASLSAEPNCRTPSFEGRFIQGRQPGLGKEPTSISIHDSRTSPPVRYEVSVHDRAVVPRDRLIGYRPDSGLDHRCRNTQTPFPLGRCPIHACRFP